MAGVEQRGGRPRPEQPRQPEQTHKSPEAGAGPLGLPPPTPGICLRWDSWNMTAVTQKCTACPSLAAAALEP